MSTSVRLLSSSLAMAMAIVTCGVGTGVTASAYSFKGCKWGGTFSSSSPISYRFSSVTTPWKNAVRSADATWDSKPVPGYFVETSSSSTMNYDEPHHDDFSAIRGCPS